MDLFLAHDGLDEAESAALSARLVLLSADHVGNCAAVLEAMAIALKSAVLTSGLID